MPGDRIKASGATDGFFLRVLVLYMYWPQDRMGDFTEPVVHVQLGVVRDPLYCMGVGLAYGLRLFIIAMQPGLLLKIFGYPAVAYISIPNYGLVDESTIPESRMPRHVFIKGVPMTLYIIASVVFAFTVSAV